MNYSQIVQILTIIKYMSLTKAAAELYISQPALSISLSRIEEKLGVKLFNREGNQLTLTKECVELTPLFVKLKNDFDALNAKASSLTYNKEESISLGFSGSALFFASTYVEDILSNFEGRTIHKVFADQNLIVDMLKTGKLDFAISYPPIKDDAIENKTLLKDSIMLVLSSAHPLADKEKITIDDIKKIKIAFFTKQNYFRRSVDAYFMDHNINIYYSTEYDYESLINLIESNRYGDHFATFSSDDGFLEWYGDGYVCKKIEGLEFSRETTLSWYKESNAIKIFPSFPQYVESIYKDKYCSYSYHSNWLR